MASVSEYESKLALVFALHLLDVYVSDEMAGSEVAVDALITDVIEMPSMLSDRVGGWRYTFACVLVPACCAGVCDSDDVEPVGHIEITTSKGTRYRMSIESLTSVANWEL